MTGASSNSITDVLQAQHKHFNTLLNKLEASSRQPSHPTSPLRYTHSYLVDSFYASDDHHDRGKVRVTRDEKTGEVRECMKKVRLGDMEIFSPKRCVDWRVSVNIEVPGPFTPFFDPVPIAPQRFTDCDDATLSLSAIGDSSTYQKKRPCVLLARRVQY